MKDNINISEGETLFIPVPNPFLLLLDTMVLSVILICLLVFLFFPFHDSVLIRLLCYFILVSSILIAGTIKNQRYKPFVMTRDSVKYETDKLTGVWLDLSKSESVSLIFHQSSLLNGSNYGLISVEYLEKGLKSVKDFGIYPLNIYNNIKRAH